MDEQLRRAAIQAVNSVLGDRLALGATSGVGSLGMLMNGARDVFAAAGYPRALTFDDYWEAYRRQDVARTIVTAKPAESWRLAPIVLDGPTVEDGKDNTPFAKAMQVLADGAEIGALGGLGSVWATLHRLDRVSGIGRYGVLYIGLRGVVDPSEPLAAGEGRSVGDLLYLSVYDESRAEIAQFVSDPNDPRFGMPEYYNLTTTTGAGDSARTTRVHWSRCIHVAEGLDSDEIYGTPRLEAAWNRLVDLLKILAGSGEAAWKLLDPGYTITANEGKRLPTTEAEIAALGDQIEDFINGYTRWLMLEGMTPQPLPGSVQDPSGLVMVNMAMIAAATEIPKRILLGTEEAQLAGAQDERRWATIIQTRQVNHVEPQIILPLVGRLVYAGVLPRPSSGRAAVRWENLLESNREAEANTAKTTAEALNAIKAKVDPKVFVEVYLPELPTDSIEEKPEPVIPPALAGGQPGQPPQPGQGDQNGPPQPPQQGDQQQGDQQQGQEEPAANVGQLTDWRADSDEPVKVEFVLGSDDAGNWFYAYP